MADQAPAFNPGRCFIVVEGQCDAPKAGKPSDNPGVINPPTMNVIYFGGRQWVKFADATQAAKVKAGDFVRVEMEAVNGRSGMFAGAGVVTHVNGKAVA